MSIAYLLVLLGMGILAAAIWALFWAVDNDQFEELESQGASILHDEPEEDPP